MPDACQEQGELDILMLSDDTRNKHSRRFKAQPNILLIALHERNVGVFAFVVAPAKGHESK